MRPIRTFRIATISLFTFIYFYHGIIVSQPATVARPPAVEHKASSNGLPSLPELVRSDLAIDTPCPNGTAPIFDTIFENQDNDRRIPRVLHITSKSRCATVEILNNIQKWRERLPDHSIYFHDDDAVERLTSHSISQQLFPLLNETLKCVTNGATKSDLWRYLLLYLYGGIYTDIDNSPGRKFDQNIIHNHDDFFAVLEGLGIIAQYFLASSPKHPLMKLSLDAGIEKLRMGRNVMKNNPSKTTGPGAIKTGFIHFMKNESDGYIPSGRYDGIEGRSVTVIGSKDRHAEYIQREGVPRAKKYQYYKALGVSHFFDSYVLPDMGAVSCMDHLRRTEGTHKVANYAFDETTREWVEM